MCCLSLRRLSLIVEMLVQSSLKFSFLGSELGTLDATSLTMAETMSESRMRAQKFKINFVTDSKWRAS